MNQQSETPDSEENIHECASKDLEFLEWCEETENDPNDPGSREAFDEHQSETDAERGDKFWDELSPEDREGYESMMTDD
jgi:hypothetical protein